MWKPTNESKLKDYIAQKSRFEGQRLSDKVSVEESEFGLEDILYVEIVGDGEPIKVSEDK